MKMRRRLTSYLYLLTLVACVSLNGLAVGQETKENAEFKLAVNLYNDGMYELALDQLTNFVNAYPGAANSIEARFFLGLAQLKLRRYEEARVTFQNFALTYAANPKAPEAWLRVGDAYAALQNYREAASAYERVHVFHPNSPLAHEALLKAALFYRKSGASDNARKCIRTILQDYPSSASVPAARLEMGELFAEQGKTALAQSEFSRAIESSTDPSIRARGTFLMAKLLFSTGRVDEATEYFNKIISQYKTSLYSASAAFALGRILHSAGRYQEAIEQFKKTVADTTAELSVREEAAIALGGSYTALGDFKSAQQQYEHFLSAFPASSSVPMVQFRAGHAAAKLGNHQAALNHFKKVINTREAELYRRKALVAAAESALQQKDYMGALGFYATYVEQFPSDPFVPDILFKIGRICEEHLMDYRRAVEYYTDILMKHSYSAHVDDALFGIGRCREELGEIDGALKTYEELLERYPSSEWGQKAKARTEFLRSHRAKNLDGGIEKLALLIGDMISGKPKPQLSLRLADIYFGDLKDYAAAARQYSTAIEAGLDQDQFVHAYYHRARSFHLLSEIDPTAAAEALTYYDAFLKQFPTGKWSDEAAFYSMQLKMPGRTDAEIIAAARDYLTKRTTSPMRDRVLMFLASSHDRIGQRREAIDALRRLARQTEGGLAAEFARTPLSQEAWLKLGKIYLQESRPDSAAHAWEMAAGSKGLYTAEALWLLGNLKMEQAQPAEAIDRYRSIVAEYFYSPFAAQAELALGDAYLAMNDVANAIDVFQSQWSRMRSSPFEETADYTPLFKLASAFYKKGDKQKAADLYQLYVNYDRRSPTAADALFALGVIAREFGNAESAAGYFRQAASISTGERSGREIADLLFETEQYAEAAKQYTLLAQKAQSEADKSALGGFQARIVLCKLKLNDFKGAQPLMAEFRKAYRKSENFLSEIDYEAALYHFRAKDYATARKALDEVASNYSTSRYAAWAEFYLGKILEVTNRPQDAVRKYETVLRKFPTSDVLPRIYLALGNISYNAEKYQEAITHYQRVVESPQTAGDILPYAMNNLIEAYEAVQLYDAALKVTRDYVAYFPNDPNIIDKRIHVGVLFTRLGYYDQAAVHLQQLLDEAGSDVEAEIRYAIGEAHYYKGDYQQAILEFLKVPYLVTQRGRMDWTATALYMAGQAYEKMQRYDQAIAMYQQIIDRPGVDAMFKAGARKEIDRVRAAVKPGSK